MTTDSAERPPLDPSRLSDNPALMPDLTVEVLASSPSTNAVVAERARAGAPDGLVVVADHQTAGRGRLDRTWETPPGTAVTFSMLLRPQSPTRAWPWLPLLAGYAVDKALKARGLDAGVKWPNDVLIGDKKVAGILVERVDTPDGPAAVVGIGVNTGLTADELPVPTATSLAIETGSRSTAPTCWSRCSTRCARPTPPGRRARTPAACGSRSPTPPPASPSDATCGSSCPTAPRSRAAPSRSTRGGRLVVDGPAGRTPVAAGDVVHVQALTS